MTKPFVSVIVPVFDDRERLELCLEALERQTYPRDRFEVVVVDNGSAQPLDDLAGRYRIRLEHEEKIGSYAARNRGLAVAAGDVIAFTDSDCIPTDDWIERGVLVLERRPRCGVLAGAIDVFARDPQQPNAVELYELSTRFRKQANLDELAYAVTANCFTRRAVIEEVGVFDERFRSSGDWEWSRRVIGAGYEKAFDAGVRVGHPARRTLAELGRYRRRIVGGVRQRDQLGLGQRPFRNYVFTPLQGTVVSALLKVVDVGRRLVMCFIPPVFTVRWMTRKAGLKSVPGQIKLGVVAWFVKWVDVLERLRLALGAEPAR